MTASVAVDEQVASKSRPRRVATRWRSASSRMSCLARNSRARRVLPVPLPISRHLEEHFVGQVGARRRTRQMLLSCRPRPTRAVTRSGVAAAEHLGSRATWPAVAERNDLLVRGTPFQFRHPLIRSAVYHRRTAADRRRIHDALARAECIRRDPRRRVRHEAAAAGVTTSGSRSGSWRRSRDRPRRGGPGHLGRVHGVCRGVTPDNRRV